MESGVLIEKIKIKDRVKSYIGRIVFSIRLSLQQFREDYETYTLTQECTKEFTVLFFKEFLTCKCHYPTKSTLDIIINFFSIKDWGE